MTTRSYLRMSASLRPSCHAAPILRGAFGLRSAILMVMIGTSTAAQAEETLLDVGTFVAAEKPCRHADRDDVLISNGRAVAPPGISCRIASRTSTGAYYPLFNAVCTGSESSTAVLSVQNQRTISFRFSGQANRSYRFCPLSATQLVKK